MHDERAVQGRRRESGGRQHHVRMRVPPLSDEARPLHDTIHVGKRASLAHEIRGAGAAPVERRAPERLTCVSAKDIFAPSTGSKRRRRSARRE